MIGRNFFFVRGVGRAETKLSLNQLSISESSTMKYSISALSSTTYLFM
ncbi:hypothetical protein K2X30_14855 [bacterium]|nr:hypothetical protein [bacterium]